MTALLDAHQTLLVRRANLQHRSYAPIEGYSGSLLYNGREPPPIVCLSFTDDKVTVTFETKPQL